MGSQISFEYGASTPGVLIFPSSTSCTAIPQGTPTYSAIAEWPDGSPYASSVDVIVSCTAECQHRLTLVTRQKGGEGYLSDADGGCTDKRVDG